MNSAPSRRAFGHRNFRLYIAGQGVSIIGTWMQQVAMAWLVFQLTGSPVWLGIAGFAGQIPVLFLTPFTGTLIDRSNRHRLLLITQSLSMIQAFLLAFLTLIGIVQAWQIVGLAFFLGTINALDMPTRQTFLSELVGKGDILANAIAVNSSVFNGARLVGPALAGLVLYWTNSGVCFLINGCSYLAVLLALCAMRLPRPQPQHAPGHLLSKITEGLAYAWRSTPIRSLLLLIGLFNIAGMAEMTLLPVIASNILHGNASTLALLSASAGAGAFAAAVLLASRRSVAGLSKWIVAAPVVFGLALVSFSLAGTLWASVLLLTATGFSLLLMTASANTILQTTVADDKRGRIMSLYTMAVTGLAPVGGLLAGLLADRVGAAVTLRLAGLACLAGALVFALRFPRLFSQS
ncbi:MAG TPA: MFS transporter, partial [Gemmataceae bacterium]|nr:MFS transporter [Gemmataceae bacterium]